MSLKHHRSLLHAIQVLRFENLWEPSCLIVCVFVTKGHRALVNGYEMHENGINGVENKNIIAK